MSPPIGSAVASALSALPWCCIGPAVFSLSGVAVAGVGVGLRTALPIFLLVSLGFLARALYLSVIRRRGRRWVRAVTVGSAVVVLAAWSFRFEVWSL